MMKYNLNAIFYFFFLEEQWRIQQTEKCVWGFLGFIANLFSFENYHNKRLRRVKNDKSRRKYLYKKVNGFCIMGAKRMFDHFCFLYSLSFGIIIFAIFLKCNFSYHVIVAFVLFSILLQVEYEIINRAVYSKDCYLDYFMQFEQEDELWHKKWKRRTWTFCICAPVSLAIGIAAAFMIITY